MIWFNDNRPSLESLNAFRANTLVEHLDIRVIEVGDDSLTGTMPVDSRTHQPYGVLHGGATVALAESLGSLGGAFCVDLTRQRVVGLEINTNHMRSVRSGLVTATAKPLHIGRQTHVWSIEQKDDRERRVAVSRITLAVLSAEP